MFGCVHFKDCQLWPSMHVTEIKKSFVNVSTKYASSRSELCERLLSKTCNVNYKIKGAIFTL